MRWDITRWNRARVVELAVALAGLAAAVALNTWMGMFADAEGRRASPSPDLLLAHLPRVDMRFFFVWGFAGFLLFAIVVGLVREGRRLAHILWLYTLLIALRSVFIILTPMRSPVGAMWVGGDPLFNAVGRYLTFHNDLFFSSHTACPYLGYLAYRDRWAQKVFLGLSILLAATVLLIRLHYSIDVFSAYFITYALYRFERRKLRAPYRRLRMRLLGFLLA